MPVLHFILKLGTWIFGAILVLFVASWLPGGAFSDFAGAVLHGVGWLFGDALPQVGQIALDRAKGA